MRSLLAYWIGGAGSAAVAVQAGAKSMLAFWSGGAGGIPVIEQAGVRSMFAFWAGGAAAGLAVATDPAGAMGMAVDHRQRILEDDKIILETMMKFMEEITKCH